MYLSKKTLISLALAAMLTASASAAGFAKINTFTEGQFVDVPAAEWYAPEIANTFELGLMQGIGEGYFNPEGNITVAEAITMASRAAALYAGETIPEAEGEWYQAYVNYALSKGFVFDGQFAAEDYDRFAKRREVAVLFSNALPADWFTVKNDVTEVPDVRNGISYSGNVLMLYQAGVLLGSDSYGNFRPEDDITRAEAAAIINRVALPESRLSRKLDKYARDDAFVLHNSYTDGTSPGMAGNKEGISSGWQLDNRGGSARTSLFDSYGTLSDISTEEGTAMIREFNNMTSGLIKLESRFTVSKDNDGIYLEYVNAAGDPIYRVETENNAWYYVNADGSKTKLCEFAAPNLTFAFDITVDLDNNRSTTYINYETVGTLPLMTSGDATNMQSFRYGTTEKSTAVISCTNINIVGNYAAHDDFDWDNGKLPFDWEGENFTARNTLGIAANGNAIRPFNPVSGTVVAESEFNTAEGEAFDIIMRSGAREIVKLSYDGNALYADGEKIYDTLVAGLWYDFRIEADTGTQTAMIRLNGIKRGEVPFAAASTSIDNVQFLNHGEKSFTIDNLHVFEKVFHEDYVPEPVIPKGEEKYNVGLNICSLWTNGTHFGWACITPFDDLEPVLGYYDEGSAELADWEIKYMVEHGIDFQAFCWYPGETGSAIKNTRQGTALRLGYKNAEYSDMMKYCLIWECANASMPKGMDAWKKYYVPYMIEHYFKDPRYMTIDNRPLLYIFGATNLSMDPDTGSKKCGFGSVQNVKAGFDYLNEELAKIGLGNVIVVASHAGSSSTLKAMGIEATAAYNWGSEGYKLSVNKSRNEGNANDTNCFTIPTISIGFNNVGWAQTRYPLMTAEDFEAANLWARDEFSPKYAKEDWQKNLFHISTWNEYGEGTCIMPMKGGDVGFGYLDALREVFTDEKADPSINTVPTEEQLRRITHRYPQHLHLLRKQGFYKEEDKTDYSNLTATKSYNMASYPTDWLRFSRIEGQAQTSEGISGTTNGSDPIVTIAGTDGPSLDEAKYLHIRMAIPEDELIEMYFTTTDSTNWEQSKGSAVKSTSGDMTDYYLDMSKNGKWKGTLQYLRIDPGAAGGHGFTLALVELMAGKPAATESKDIYINNQKVTMQLPPQKSAKGDYLVAFDPFIAMDFRLNAFHTWDKANGVLTLMLGKHTVVYTVGSDKYVLDGKEKALGFKLELLDGLPLIPLEMLCKDVGYKYEINDKGVSVETNEFSSFKAAEARVPCQWEFNVNGDTEGWKSSLMSLLVADGYLSASSITDSIDPVISLSGIEFDSAKYNKIEYRVRYDYNPRFTDEKDENGNLTGNKKEIQEALTMYFATTYEPTLSEAKTIKLMLKGHTSDGEWQVFEGEINNEKWDGMITQLRFDPFNAVGTCDVDYIRFIEDPDYEAKANAPVISEIKNGDAEKTSNVAFTSHNGNIAIVEDPDKEGNHVYRNISKDGSKQWLYSRQGYRLTPGATYKVEYDARIAQIGIEDADPSDEEKYAIMCNFKYSDSLGKVDHIVHSGSQSPADGWVHYSFEYTVLPSTDRSADEFTLYTNPVGDTPVGYYFDNVKVTMIGGEAAAAETKTETKKEEAAVDAGEICKNGDAEGSAVNAFYGASGNATVSIAKDPFDSSNKVWYVEPGAGKVWAYARQNTMWSAGASYKISFDLLAAGSSASCNVNIKYADPNGDGADAAKTDTSSHIKGCSVTDEKWEHFEYEFTIIDSLSNHSSDQISFYSNPNGEEGVGYYFDNVVVERVD